MSETRATGYPHIVIGPVLDEPIIEGTNITVRLIAYYYRQKAAVEEIERAHPALSLSAIHSAISYYLDHRDEMDKSPIEAELAEVSAIIQRNRTAGSYISGAELRKRMAARGVVVG